MIVALLVVAFSAHSLGVLAAGTNYVADSTAIALGILAVTVRDRVGGHWKAPTVVVGINVGALLVGSGFVLVAGVGCLVQGTPNIHGWPVLIVSARPSGTTQSLQGVAGCEQRPAEQPPRQHIAGG